MTSQKSREWHEKLATEQAKIEQELEQLKEATNSTSREAAGDLSSHSSHIADQGTDTMEREKLFLFAAQKRKRLAEVGEALRRVQEGTFGTCAACGEAIPARRLERMPAASTCVRCQEKIEKDSVRNA